MNQHGKTFYGTSFDRNIRTKDPSLQNPMKEKFLSRCRTARVSFEQIRSIAVSGQILDWSCRKSTDTVQVRSPLSGNILHGKNSNLKRTLEATMVQTIYLFFGTNCHALPNDLSTTLV